MEQQFETVRNGSLTEIGLATIAGVLAPHTLHVGSANGAISREHSIKLLEVYLYSGIKGGELVQKFGYLRMMIAVSELQQSFSFGS